MKALIQKYAEKYSLDPAIVYGVCMTESSMNPKATRFEPGYKWLYHVDMCAKEANVPFEVEKRQQMTSFGIMQLMGGVLREYNYWGRLSDILYSPDAQIAFGCRHLASKIAKYGLELGILAYNSGSPGRDLNGVWFPPEQQHNADYLKKVMRYAAQFTLTKENPT